MTTIQDIADRLGISKGTVSKALNDAPDISETLRRQVLETAVELGYTRLRRYKESTKKVCVLVQKDNMGYEEPHHLAYNMILGFRKIAEPAGFEVEVLPVDSKSQHNCGYDVFMLEHDCAGAFVIGMSLSDPWMNDFKTCRTPAVLYDNYLVGNPNVSYVGVDNEEGMELAVSHLTALGHRKIAYLSSSLGSQILQMRYSAFFHAMRRHGLKVGSGNVGCSYYLSECMEQHLPRFLKNGMTAVICCHDAMANAALLQCQQTGVRVPDEVSIIGFDDLQFSGYTSPPLTTIRQDLAELGKSGFYSLNSLLSGTSIGTFLLHAQLIERSSSGPVPQ